MSGNVRVIPVPVRVCAACQVMPAAGGDRYCDGCGSASDRQAWAVSESWAWWPPALVPTNCYQGPHVWLGGICLVCAAWNGREL